MEGAYKGMVGGLDLFSGYLSKEEFQVIQKDPVGGFIRTMRTKIRAALWGLASVSPGKEGVIAKYRDRKKAEELMLAATTGRLTSWLRTPSRVVLPQRFTGDVTAKRGETKKLSNM